jgi:hypothetical protein
LRRTYVTTSVLALYFNFFVLIVQSFDKIPALKTLAPTQKEAPFKVTKLVALRLFVGLGVFSAVKFRGKAEQQALSRAA